MNSTKIVENIAKNGEKQKKFTGKLQKKWERKQRKRAKIGEKLIRKWRKMIQIDKKMKNENNVKKWQEVGEKPTHKFPSLNLTFSTFFLETNFCGIFCCDFPILKPLN